MDIALIDGDIIAYRASVVVEGKEIDWDGDGDVTTIAPSPVAVRENTKSLVRNWTKMAGAKRQIVALSPRDGNTFRKHILPTYKSNREGNVKPELYNVALETLESEFDILRLDGVEADDVLGISQTNPRLQGRTVIVTIDKDMQGVPGLYFRPGRDVDGKPRLITQQTADYFWMIQTLVGDPVDGYKGAPGIGIKKAQTALMAVPRTLDVMWPVVLKLFESKKLTLDDALTQARVARILRHTDYLSQEGKIRLWHPSKMMRATLNLPLPSLRSIPPKPSPASPPPPRSSRKVATSASSSRSR